MYSRLLSIGSAFSQIGYICLAILILMLMITIHEFGHYSAGKLLKFKINEFSIGFGKAIFTKTKKNGEIFSIRLIPLGGYCAFDGEDATEDGGNFNEQAPWKRLIVLFCGAFFNFLSAILFSIVLLAVVGSGISKIETVEGQNADILQKGDIVCKVNGEKLSFLNGGIVGITQDIKADTDIKFEIERDGKVINVVVQKHNVMIDGSEVPMFGITTSYAKISFGQALLQAVPFTFNMAWECLVILGKLLIGQYGLQDIGGPITTIGAIANASSVNMLNLLLLIPLIAVNLAVFNLLPIPALDGAKMVFVLIEWVRGKPINRELENKIHTIGLIALFGFVILVDVLHLFMF